MCIIITIIVGIIAAGIIKKRKEKLKNLNKNKLANMLAIIMSGIYQKGFIPLIIQKINDNVEKINHNTTIKNEYASTSPGSIKRNPMRKPIIPDTMMHSDNNRCIILILLFSIIDILVYRYRYLCRIARRCK